MLPLLIFVYMHWADSRPIADVTYFVHISYSVTLVTPISITCSTQVLYVPSTVTGDAVVPERYFFTVFSNYTKSHVFTSLYFGFSTLPRARLSLAIGYHLSFFVARIGCREIPVFTLKPLTTVAHEALPIIYRATNHVPLCSEASSPPVVL